MEGQDTILQQLAGDTITSQLVELANEAWRTERRGRGGKWVGPGGAVGAAERTAKGAARIQRIQARSTASKPSVSEPNKAAAVVHQVRSQTPQERQLLADLKPLIDQEVARALAANPVVPQHVMSQAEKVVDAKLHAAQQLAEQKQQTHEIRKARLKLAVEASLAVTGGILATLAAKAGAPEAVTIFATVGPFLMQTIIEFFKKL